MTAVLAPVATASPVPTTSNAWASKPFASEVIASATPTIAGIASVGRKLVAHPGKWTAGATLTYQWLAAGTPIAGATASALTPTPAMLGKRITLRVTGSLAGFETATQTSKPTLPVTAGTLTAPVPTIVGTAAIGTKLTVRPGTWTAGTKLTYQWLAAGNPIAGATGSALALTNALLGKRITVRVTGTHVGYVRAIRTSVPTPAVGKPLSTGTPTISGVAAVTKVLTARAGTWTAGTKLTYRWYADGVAIGNATATTLRLTTAQQGKSITVRVTGSKSGYATVTRGSGATAKVAPDPNRGKSRTSPYTAGTAFTLGSWTLRLGHTITNAWPQIQQQNMFNSAPKPGWSFVMVPVTFTHLVAAPMQPWVDTDFDFIGSNGVAYSHYENSQSCGVLPNDAYDIGDMYRGATAAGNVCAVVPTSVIAGGVWRAEADIWNEYRYIGQ